MSDNLEIRIAKASEVEAVQTLDSATWEDGFKYYSELYDLYRHGILVAVSDRVIGFIGAERINPEDIVVGEASGFTKSMPPWNHDPRNFHKPTGSVLYIVGHAVLPEYWRQGASEALIRDFLKRAREQKGGIEFAAVIYNLRHPTLMDPLKFWGGYGFKPVLKTYDPLWKHANKIKPDGGIIWVVNL